MYSAWFNHTKDFTGVFVPSTCCRLLVLDPRKPRVQDENQCQVQALLHRNTRQPMTQLHTQVRIEPAMAGLGCLAQRRRNVYNSVV